MSARLTSTEDHARRGRRRLLGEMLIRHGVISRSQLGEAVARQKHEPETRLGRLLVDLGFASEVQICEAIAEGLAIPAADLQAVDVPPDIVARLERDLAVQHCCLPWLVEGRDLYLVMADPTNVAAADAVAFHTGLRVKPVVAPESDVVAAIERFYGGDSTPASDPGAGLSGQVAALLDTASPAGTDLEEAALAEPVVRLVSGILADAIRMGASDIHLEPQEKGLQIRYRVDGLLRPVMSMPRAVQSRVTSRVKVMAHLDVSDRRRPQNGRTVTRVDGRTYDLRVSTLPTANGEKGALRVLAQDRASLGIEALGFEPDMFRSFTELLRRPQGMILVTGPTGSGKTSTLYAALHALRNDTSNIVTVEDHIEYRLAGVNQVAVSERAGLTFAAGLRSILHQDPDVVMVGEIRDAETAQVAFQAAQTGRLVLSTLHTNDAPGAVTRLVEMGVPAHVVASLLLAVLGQRLVRRRCECGAGCTACHDMGFRGRLGVYELMRLTPAVRGAVIARASEDEVRAAARAGGLRTLFDDGLRKVAAGHTTLDEVKRVVPPGDDDAVPAPRATLGVRPAVASGPARILVVDDDPSFADAMKDILEAGGFDAGAATSGQEALRQCAEQVPDLVLTDYHMPGMNGVELLQALRRDPATAEVPVAFITVRGTVGAEVDALDLGAEDYLGKPVSGRRLFARIRRILDRTRPVHAA